MIFLHLFILGKIAWGKGYKLEILISILLISCRFVNVISNFHSGGCSRPPLRPSHALLQAYTYTHHILQAAWDLVNKRAFGLQLWRRMMMRPHSSSVVWRLETGFRIEVGREFFLRALRVSSEVPGADVDLGPFTLLSKKPAEEK